MSTSKFPIITASAYEQGCKRRFGRANPERTSEPVWEWMVRTRLDPFAARQQLKLGSHYGDNAPDWAFVRFGMTRTPMPDGRTICIAGEHEDSYDPDFCIYNDVTVLRPADQIPDVEMYAYPEGQFPPTDFHSATLVGDQIIIMGRLGYAGSRRIGETPVLALDTTTYKVREVSTHGTPPGWVYEHHAWLDKEANAIVVRGGKIERGDKTQETENHSAYRLRLADWTWELIKENEAWSRFALDATSVNNWKSDPTPETYRPSEVAHDWLPPEDHGAPVYTFSVRGIRVTVTDFGSTSEILIEGELPGDTRERLIAEILKNLARDTGVSWTSTSVDQFKRPFAP